MKRMYLPAIMITIFAGLFLTSSCMVLHKPMGKSEVISNIEAWYRTYKDGYALICDESTAKANTTRYHPDRPEEKDDLIRIHYKNSKMEITLAFQKPLNEMTWHEDTLKKYFSYAAVDDIYNDIPADGWNIYPNTPSSSTSEGVEFMKAKTGILTARIDWRTYTVFGYSTSEECQEELSIADKSISEKCFVSVPGNCALHIDIDLPVE